MLVDGLPQISLCQLAYEDPVLIDKRPVQAQLHSEGVIGFL